ncbi:hypothetical protein OE88DRAFT_1034672 [Heliocybe sulcata]|uniref:Uncharacterized protein n=1 Tax=Heliocybe sulcata TaxID=5364 RepID=A0A5C3NFS8_9AGAM|nr:hypothetical protein OE88DRAFT_1034672 [Heliocybe sulcata]
MLKTKENTRRNAHTGSGYPYLPSALLPKPDRKVKFAGSIRRKNGDENKARSPTPSKEIYTGIALSCDEKQPAHKEPVRPGVVPRFGSASRIPTVRWDKGGLRLEHKASTQTVGSESVYSTQSAEPHVQGSERGSRGSKYFSIIDPRRLSTWTRSSGSMYSQPDDSAQVLGPLPVVQPLQIPPKVVTPKMPSVPELSPEITPPPRAPERRGTKTPPPVAPRAPDRGATRTPPPRAPDRSATKTPPPRAPERSATRTPPPPVPRTLERAATKTPPPPPPVAFPATTRASERKVTRTSLPAVPRAAERTATKTPPPPPYVPLAPERSSTLKTR